MGRRARTGNRSGLGRALCRFSALILGLSLVFGAPLLWAQEPNSVLLTGARILNAAGDGYLASGHSILVEEERIARILAPGETTAASRRLDLSGLTVIPGLIDLHSHLLLHPYDEASWNDQVLKEQLELRVLRAVPAAKKTLEAGFTTLRELGTEGGAYADVALRDGIRMGLIPGPRLFVATRAVVVSGAYGPSGFDPRWTLPKGAQVADGPVEVRKAVREQIAAGADWIKIYADYRRRPGGPSTATFTAEEIAAAVHEARSAGIPVAAHASTDEAIRRAVEAGVQTIEHGYQASMESLALMRERGVVLCPTLAASYAIARYQGWRPGEPEPKRILDARSLMTRALEVGVTVAMGSDVGVFAHGDNARELELMVDYGMKPAEALASATHIAAEVLGRQDDLGRVDEGFLADLVVVDGDPLMNVDALRQVRVVLQNGRVVADRR